MTKYFGIFDRQGNPMAFYAEGINQIPNGAQPVSQDDWKKYLSGQYIRNKDGVCIEKETISDDVLLSQTIVQVHKKLNSDLTNYIYSKYDVGTQASFTALYALESTPAEVKEGILEVWNWIQSVMSYYYNRKNHISKLKTVRGVNKSSWNFSQFNKTLPKTTLESVYSEI